MCKQAIRHSSLMTEKNLRVASEKLETEKNKKY